MFKKVKYREGRFKKTPQIGSSNMMYLSQAFYNLILMLLPSNSHDPNLAPTDLSDH